MTREAVLTTAEPITAVECVTAAAEIDGDLGVGRLWDGGGIQIAGDDLALAVLRSTRLDVRDDASHLLGIREDDPGSWLTEVYGPDGSDITGRLIERLADLTAATVYEEGSAAGRDPRGGER